MWTANSYVSANIALNSEGESESEEEEDPTEEDVRRDISYVVGDVTHPKHTKDNDAIVVHCVGKVLCLVRFVGVGRQSGQNKRWFRGASLFPTSALFQTILAAGVLVVSFPPFPRDH